MHRILSSLVVVLAVSPAVASPYKLLCELHPIGKEAFRVSRTYELDPVAKTFEGRAAVFTDTTVVVEKPFLENAPYRDTIATYTLSRLDGRIDIQSREFGVAPYVGNCKKAASQQF